jgi:hypothetical protein
MTTQDIVDQVATFQDLSENDKFRKAVEKVLKNNDLPIKFRVATPFHCFNGKKFDYKYRISNTETNKGISFGKTWNKDINHEGSTTGHYQSVPVEGGINTVELIPAHTKEEVDPISWGQIALIISKAFKDDIATYEPCWKCEGKGRIPHYMHIHDGICFKCCGTGGEIVEKK